MPAAEDPGATGRVADAWTSLVPLPGGWSGETFLAGAPGEQSVVRIYAGHSLRGAAAAEVDAALLRLVSGLVPVPRVLELRRADPVAGRPALLITELLPGRRADEVLPTLGAEGRRRLGGNLGVLLADLGGMPMLRRGPFLDADLSIGTWDALDGVPELVEHFLPQLAHLGRTEVAALRSVADRAQEALDGVGRSCLVHSDFNLKNLLVAPDTLRVTGLVDWEYAHAGHPFTDLGNLLRFERDPDFSDAVLTAYAARRGVEPRRALELARAADLAALVDLSARREQNPVAARADRLLRSILASGDLSGGLDEGVRDRVG
ncbi:phosphotransferase family protein [Nocardioides ferulae]|uniref:phosphotransferase family protein n=1 Tax=Nocardioides ferulae TaxID=2340821 RepID=UPI000EB27BD0|nr:phosphotransferase [Nocardioides ferulae]